MPQAPRSRYPSSSAQRRQAPGRPQRRQEPRRQEPRRDASSALDAALTAAAALPEPPEASFADLGVHPRLVTALAARGITGPFAIQSRAIPDALAGRDVLGRAQTGSGKTLAFGLPMLTRLAARTTPRQQKAPRALILVPTRELAQQVADVLTPLGHAIDVSIAAVYGGVPISRQIQQVRSADVVVATPGRLADLTGRHACTLGGIEITALDEADHMADLGFLPAVTRILAATPGHGQRMLFSATLDNDVDRLVKRFLRNPVTHSVDAANSIVPAMTHHVFHVAGGEAKKELVHRLASGTGRRVLFMRTKHQARKLAKQLTESGVPSVDLHGNLSQPARDRNLAAFSTGKARVLVATDIAARGVHVDAVELVVHVDPPADHKAYLHRSGRTARAGSAGDVVTVVLPEQCKDLRSMMRRAGIDVIPQHVTAHSAPVQALVGEIAPYHASAHKAERTPNSAHPKGNRSRRSRSSVSRQRGHIEGRRSAE